MFKNDILSPLLVDILLYEMEIYIKKWNSKLIEPNISYKKLEKKNQSMGVIRYEDILLITYYDKQSIVELIQELNNWFKETSKFELSKEKTQIRFIREGFDFLGFRIISLLKNGNYITKIYPQKASVKKITQNAHNIIFSNKAARAEWLILKLRPVLLNWANYFKYSDCSKTFNKLDYTIWKMLRKWINRRSTAGGRIKAWNKYFPGTKTIFKGKIYKDKYILKASFNLNEKIFLPKVSWIKSKKWTKIK